MRTVGPCWISEVRVPPRGQNLNSDLFSSRAPEGGDVRRCQVTLQEGALQYRRWIPGAQEFVE